MSVLTDYEVKQWDIGTEIGVVVRRNGAVVDLSAATVKRLIFRKPNRKVIIKDASFKTDGTDGHLVYFTEEHFLDMPGGWYGEVYLELPTPVWKGSSTQIFIKVLASILTP